MIIGRTIELAGIFREDKDVYKRQEYARTKGIPFLGICLGMQVAVIEYARHICGMEMCIRDSNYALWYMKLEILFVLIFPLVAYGRKRLPLLLALGLVTAVACTFLEPAA